MQRPNSQRDRKPQEKPEDKLFDERVIHVNRVARVVKGGRRFRFQALVVVGDRKNKVGVGVSKGADVTAAVTKATEVAKKHMVGINLYKGTLPHETESRVGGAHILVKPAAPGTGLIAGGVVRTVLEVAGVHNALSKSLGSSNKINTAYATVAALQQGVPSKLWITTMNRPANRPAKSKPAVTNEQPAKEAPVAQATKEAPKPAAKATAKPATKKAKG